MHGGYGRDPGDVRLASCAASAIEYTANAMRFLAVLAFCAVSVVGCAEREKPPEESAPPPPATNVQPVSPTSEKVTPAKFSAIKDIRKVMPKVGFEAPASSAAPSASAADAGK